MHLAAADVHVVRDRVGELHRDRPDLAAHAAKVVEQPGSLARKLREERCEAGARPPPSSLFRGSAAFGASSSALDALLLEPPLPCGGAGFRGHAAAGDGERLAKLRDEPLDRQLAVPSLAPLVLGDRTNDRTDTREDSAALSVRERRRGLDLERRLDPRRRLLRVLAASGRSTSRRVARSRRAGGGRSV